MYAINGYNDYVSPLINPIIVKDHTIYLETTENPDGGMRGDYEGFHMVNLYFRYEDGEFICCSDTGDRKGTAWGPCGADFRNIC